MAIEIRGVTVATESVVGEWIAVPAKPSTVINPDGFRPTVANPNGGNVSTEWERPINYRWSFNDGSGELVTGERPSISHAFRNSGNYTIQVEAHTSDGIIGIGELPVTVRNRTPNNFFIRAARIGPEPGKYLLTATADDAPGDTIAYDWDFGDGGFLTDGGWQLYHHYPPGRYEISVTARDGDGEVVRKSLNLRVAGGTSGTEDQVGFFPEEQAEEDELTTNLELAISGDVQAGFKGDVLPFAGIHLTQVKQDGKNKCRFMFTAFDDSQLMVVKAIFDLAGITEEGGDYLLNRPVFHLVFFPDKESYEDRHAAMLGPTGGHMGILVNPARAIADPSSIAKFTGLRPRSPPEIDYAAIADHSAFGVSTVETLHSTSGQVALRFVPHRFATGSVNLRLVNRSQKAHITQASVNGEFSFDLQQMQSNGIMLYDQCGPAEFAIESVNPDDDPKHVFSRHRISHVLFSEPYEPASLTADTFQLTYPDAQNNEPVPVETIILRGERDAFLKPEEPLFPGVRYTVGLKTGEDGVRGRNGVALEDTDGSGWYTWTYTTKVNLETDISGPDENLGCHVFQSVRDAPLIADKPAVARIYAHWNANPLVHESAQVTDFGAYVTLMNGSQEVASEFHRFVRPDRWSSEGVSVRNAEHTANLFWMPTASTPSSMRVALNVRNTAESQPKEMYWTRCNTEVWEHQPELRVLFYKLAINRWEDNDQLSDDHASTMSIFQHASTFIQQQFPFYKVDFVFKDTLRHPLNRRLLNPGEDCDSQCAANLLFHHTQDELDNTDVIFGFVPLGGPIGGGGAAQRISRDEPGVIILGINAEPEHHDRFVYATVHELGHTLWLEHLPYVHDTGDRAALIQARDDAFSNNFSPVHWYQGIEGFRMAEDGQSGWNKSSQEGNQEGPWLTPLMFPGTIHYRNAHIVRHQYLKMQADLEQRNGRPRGP
jgi:hypothetical protein